MCTYTSHVYDLVHVKVQNTQSLHVMRRLGGWGKAVGLQVVKDCFKTQYTVQLPSGHVLQKSRSKARSVKVKLQTLHSFCPPSKQLSVDAPPAFPQFTVLLPRIPFVMVDWDTHTPKDALTVVFTLFSHCNRPASFCDRMQVKKTDLPNAAYRLKVNVDGESTGTPRDGHYQSLYFLVT